MKQKREILSRLTFTGVPHELTVAEAYCATYAYDVRTKTVKANGFTLIAEQIYGAVERASAQRRCLYC